MTITVFGIALPPAAERAYHQGSALATNDDIAEGTAKLLEFLAAWAEMYEGDRACLTQINDFLGDYFYERTHEAAETLGLSLREIDETRDGKIEKLVKGALAAGLECDVCQHVRPLSRVVAYGVETFACDECLGREPRDLAAIEKLALGERP